jgi:hypothetical protein
MPGFFPGRSAPMAERSTPGLIGMFFVFPILAGGALLSMTITIAVRESVSFTASDWFWKVGWSGLLALGLMTALPAAGWQELAKRRALKMKSNTPRRPSR